MNKKSNESGSLVIEAAIIMPIFLAFIIAMISFVQMTIIDMALKSAVVETTKHISTHAYPFYLLSEMNKNKLDSTFANLEKWREFIPPEIADLFTSQMGVKELIDTGKQEGIRFVLLPILKQFADENILNPDHLDIVHVTFPSLNPQKDAVLGMTVSYKYPLLIPFLSREIEIRKKGYERIWIGSG